MGQYQKQYHDFPADERAILARLVEESGREAREQAIREYARVRKTKRMCQRRRGEDDRWRRTMLAIHVPFDYAMAVTARAEAQGMTVYQFLRRAVDAAMDGPSGAQGTEEEGH